MTEQGQLVRELKKAIAAYLDEYVVQPAARLVSTDFAAQHDIASLLALHHILLDVVKAEVGMPLDLYLRSVLAQQPVERMELAELLSQLPEGGAQIAELRTVFCSYVFSLANSVCISILAASYLAALIVTRSLLELLVSVGAGRTGTMSEKIANLPMLAVDEKKVVSECWRELSGWTHPYRKWLKNLCPVLVAKGPLHHPEMTRDCLVYLGICTDLAFAIAFDKLALAPDLVRSRCLDQHIDYRRFLFLRRRVESVGAG